MPRWRLGWCSHVPPSRVAGRCLTSGEPVTGIPRGTAPSLLNTSYTITAEIEIPGADQGRLALSSPQAREPVKAEGMIVTDGGRFGGYGMYLLKGKPVFLWNLLDL